MTWRATPIWNARAFRTRMHDGSGTRAPGATSRFIAYVNADAAENYGAEIEVRKQMGFLSHRLSGLSLFTNATIMESEIDLGTNQAAATNKTRRMVGQAPYVVNAGATYATRGGETSA